MYQMAIKCINIFHDKTLQNLPKMVLFENIPSVNLRLNLTNLPTYVCKPKLNLQA
jgi:hypothetical protein